LSYRVTFFIGSQVANYIDERLTVHFVEHHFHRELRKLEEESIILPDVTFPDNVAVVELFGN
jgi:hypothetical protein